MRHHPSPRAVAVDPAPRRSCAGYRTICCRGEDIHRLSQPPAPVSFAAPAPTTPVESGVDPQLQPCQLSPPPPPWQPLGPAMPAFSAPTSGTLTASRQPYRSGYTAHGRSCAGPDPSPSRDLCRLLRRSSPREGAPPPEPTSSATATVSHGPNGSSCRPWAIQVVMSFRSEK
jgi:hypothetical protein